MPEVVEKTTSQVDLIKHRDASSFALSDDPDSISSFHFKLPVFEGPLDLLLHLIRDNKIDIYDIPIVDITHQYLTYVELMKELNLEIAGDFLLMAATLIHIKSKMLLPPAEEETEEPEGDPRAELVRRLLEYQAYKESSTQLRKREDIWKNVFCRPLPDEDDFEFDPDPVLTEANVYDLIAAFKTLLAKTPEETVEITRETLTVSDRINYIIERLESEDGIKFENLFEEGFTRIVLIVTFLALLELVRLGLVKIYQEKSFGIIWIINPQQGNPSESDKVVEEIVS
jgi:segregation and condensation protein A